MNPFIRTLSKNSLYLLLIGLLITLSILLFIKSDNDVKILAKEKIFSIYHSNNLETIEVELLTTNKESFHFIEEYIVSSALFTEDERLSVQVTNIEKTNNTILYNEEVYDQVIITLKLPFVSNDLLIEMEEVSLELIYENEEVLQFKVGEFNYLFLDDYGTDITLGNLSATHEIINGYNTIGGVSIELGNSSDHNIYIKDIRILSNDVHINKTEISEYTSCGFTDRVKDCLQLDYYNFNEVFDDIELNILLGRNNTIDLYLPLLYNSDISYIYEFAIVIEYEVNTIPKQIIIDNFPYMKTSIFNEMNEEDIHVYTPSS